MCKTTQHLATVAIIFVSISLSANVVMTESYLGGFRLSKCQLEGPLCLRVDAVSGVGSHFSPIFSLKNIKMTLNNRKSGRVIGVVKTKTGYVDFASDQIVCIERTKSVTKEHVIRLRDLSEKTYIVKLR